jgi:hypothetical protein
MRRLPLLGGLLAAGLACAAHAQDVDVTALQMKACGQIKDDAARVRCYDRAMQRPASDPALTTISPSSGAALVPIPQAPAVASPPPAAWSAPQAPAAAPQAPAAAATPAPSVPVPLGPAPVNPASPTVAHVEPAAPARSAVPPPAPPEKGDGGLFGMGSILRAITPSGSADAGDGAWEVKADKAALQEATRLLATLKSPDEYAVLVLQCRNAQAEANVTIPRFLGWESMRVRWRVNDGPASDGLWAAAADGRGVVAGNAAEFINALPDGGTLDVRLTDYEGTAHELRFRLGAISSLRAQIATVCRWPVASVQEPPAYEPAPPASRDARKKPVRPGAVGAPLQLH